jgi:hypothetical protein
MPPAALRCSNDAAAGVAALDPAVVFATWWNADRDAKQRRCAEVLVPDWVAPDYIRHVYVAGNLAQRQLRTTVPGQDLDIRVNGWLFYGEGPR